MRGWNVMKGYYKNPEATAKAFTPTAGCAPATSASSPPTAGCAWSGALKDMFRVGGENVAPAEVEEVLLAHPAVETAQVVGVPDARLGEVGAAFVTLKAEALGDRARTDRVGAKAALRQFPRAALPRDRRRASTPSA